MGPRFAVAIRDGCSYKKKKKKNKDQGRGGVDSEAEQALRRRQVQL